MMPITGKNYNGKILKNVLLQIRQTQIISFEEKQADDVSDIVYCSYDLHEQQYGIFSNEYRPSPAGEGKKVDLLLFVIDEKMCKFRSWVLDIKVSVGGDEIIYKLINQWKESVKIKTALSVFNDGYSEEMIIGVITRDFQKERIERSIERHKEDIIKRQNEVENMPPTSVVMPVLMEIEKIKTEKIILEDFLNYVVKIGENVYPYTVFLSQKENEQYSCKLDLRL